MEYWSNGVMEEWKIGVMGGWGNGILESMCGVLNNIILWGEFL